MERKLLSALFQLKTALNQCGKQPYKIGETRIILLEPILLRDKVSGLLELDDAGHPKYRTHVYSHLFYSPMADIERLRKRITKLMK